MGHKSPEDYAKVAIEAAKLMRWIDKDIKLIASGSSNYDADWNKWNRTILDEMYNYIDYISLHHYAHNTSDYYTNLTNTIEVENYIRIVEQQIKEAKMKSRSSRRSSLHLMNGMLGLVPLEALTILCPKYMIYKMHLL